MADLIDKAISVINMFVNTWTKKYLFTTIYEEETDQGHK
jgi:hypothetical protein